MSFQRTLTCSSNTDCRPCDACLAELERLRNKARNMEDLATKFAGEAKASGADHDALRARVAKLEAVAAVLGGEEGFSVACEYYLPPYNCRREAPAKPLCRRCRLREALAAARKVLEEGR